MQPLTASPREHLTAAQVEALIVDAPGLIVGYGAELVDQALTVLADLSPDLRGGSCRAVPTRSCTAPRTWGSAPSWTGGGRSSART
ncbi:hypothetical protein [Micromonospora sp. 4G55]|uniref:hypothetical protein n=1 Tax=Micromonospora sp. 4G55 TaxID=2806102 RepID=UPI001A593BE8|nr:hypothetical protein [Micromonospora sp. 4G55]MBM0257045.1 hypothetical protein [Micromonospora sp. 4G55]